MKKVKIITDSCSDLPKDLIKEYGIDCLNIPVNIDNKIYYDRGDLQPPDFYRMIGEEKKFPKTSRIIPTEFKKVYKNSLKEYDQILVISFSSKLSGILESAVIAKRQLKADKTDRITVIDSKAASVGQGLIVYKAAKMLADNVKLEQVVDNIVEEGSKLEHVFAVGNIKMLKKGGRISRTKAAVAGVLNIKPILHIQDGEILAYDRVRGKKRMMQYLIDEIEQKADKPEEQIIAVTYSQDKKYALKLKEKIEQKFNPREIFISEIGAAVGSHTGAGTLAVVYKNSEKIANLELY